MPTGYNLVTRARSTAGKMSFGTLDRIIGAYDTARICIEHIEDDIRSLEWRVTPMDGIASDVTDAVSAATRLMKKPDGTTPFDSWVIQWLEDILRYDAGALHKIRTRSGALAGLEVVSGTEIAPLLNYGGRRPVPPAPAFVQFLNGVPGVWMSDTNPFWQPGDLHELIYQPYRPQPQGPYGLPPMEYLLLNANTDLRFQWYFLQFFCYDDQTEVLTRDGWRRFDVLDGSEEFATRSAEGEFEWQHTKDQTVHRFDYDGDLVHFDNQCVDMAVTPNHRMLVRRMSQRGEHTRWHDWHIRRADYFVDHPTAQFQVPITSTWTGIDPGPEIELTAEQGRQNSPQTLVRMPMWAWARFLGLYLAEGWRRRPNKDGTNRWEITVAQWPGGSLDEVRRVLKDTGLAWRYTERTGKFTVGCKALWLALAACGDGAPNKHLPEGVLDWTPALLGYLLDGLMMGDGTVTKSGQSVYVTTSPVLADQVQEAWQKTGTYAWVRPWDPPPETKGKLRQYHVRTRTEDAFRVPRPTLRPYHGQVSCVSVPNGIILVRRNGKAMWCGNTDGSVPDQFATAPPDQSRPDQIEQWQELWDAAMEGDQSAKHKIKWVPAGTELHPARTGDSWNPEFPLYLMRKTAAAYKVNVNDLGFTDNSNRSTGETQVDVQFRVGTKPRAQYLSNIINSFLQDDLMLPVQFDFDLGQESEDRLAEAQTWAVWIQNGVCSPDEPRSKILGLPTDPTMPTPRYVFTSRGGPIPLSAVLGVAGELNTETFAPSNASQLPHSEFIPIPGVVPAKPPQTAELATQMYGATVDPDAAQPLGAPSPADVGNQGVTTSSAAGVQADGSFDAQSALDANGGEPDTSQVAKAQEPLTLPDVAINGALRRSLDRFNSIPATAVVKQDGPTCAGLVVVASDTGRILLLQRAMDDDDPAGGCWEFPGGHLEPGETPLQAARREWQEEIGVALPAGTVVASWVSANEVYKGFVYVIDSEDGVLINLTGSIRHVLNPDDPDQDGIEVAAFFLPEDCPSMPSLRMECQSAPWDVIMNAVNDAKLSVVKAQRDLISADLRRWRDMARNRVRDGHQPREFRSAVIPTWLHQKIAAGLEVNMNLDAIPLVFEAALEVVKADNPKAPAR
jgi:8-oxo-dGTP pyrophosphatase MutT (NUDIX family)